MKPYLIGITGGSGSGKTTFIRELRAHFPEKDLCVISQDEYYLPLENQELDEEGIENFDLPSSIDLDAFCEDIERLRSGHSVTRREYTFNNLDKKPELMVYLPAPIILVEGIFVFHFEKIRDLLDLRVFLHAKENLKVIRRIKRDQIERNYPLDDVLYRYENHVLPTFEKYIKPYMDEADIVINNNDCFDAGLEVMQGFLKRKLQEFTRESDSAGKLAGPMNG